MLASIKTGQFRSCQELSFVLWNLNLEARVGIEPTHKGFADLSLTTWVPRLGWAIHFSPSEL